MARKSHRRSSKNACRGRRKVKARWSSKRCKRARRPAKSYQRKGRGRRTAGRRNPGMDRTLRDGTTVNIEQVGSKGVVHVIYPDGSTRDYKSSWPAAMKRFHAIKSGRSHERRAKKDDWAMLAADNPRRGRGRTRRNCGMTKDPRYATTRIIRRGGKTNPRKVFHPRHISKWSRIGRNPAQFSMPFASALNPRISRKEARGMSRVLRRHGYKRCKV